MQKTLIIIGMVITLVGIFWPVLGYLKLGRLPGDIIIKKEFTFYFPIVTCLIISLLFAIIVWLLRKW